MWIFAPRSFEGPASTRAKRHKTGCNHIEGCKARCVRQVTQHSCIHGPSGTADRNNGYVNTAFATVITLDECLDPGRLDSSADPRPCRMAAGLLEY
jgi:hypothetical protein